MMSHNTHHIWYDLSFASKSRSMAFEHCKKTVYIWFKCAAETSMCRNVILAQRSAEIC